MPSKKELRSNYKAKRSGITESEMIKLSSSVLSNLVNEEFLEHEVYHMFLPISRHSEIDTWPLFKRLLSEGKRVVLSISDFKTNTLQNYEVDLNTKIETNSWGIPEPVDGTPIPPEEIDVVVVPLLAFDKAGFRVGYGKGFYDNFLAQCRSDVKKVGVSVFGPEDQIDDVRQEDIQLSSCVCPDRVYKFSDDYEA